MGLVVGGGGGGGGGGLRGGGGLGMVGGVFRPRPFQQRLLGLGGRFQAIGESIGSAFQVDRSYSAAAAAACFLARLRSSGLRKRLRSRIDFGVTSTSSSSSI